MPRPLGRVGILAYSADWLGPLACFKEKLVARSLKLLHIEDDRIQRLLIAHHLGTMKDFEVTIVSAESENEAMKIFGQGGFEFVILDYHLIQGNGLSCLHQIRRRDPLIPIVAISGEATPEIAA